MTPKSIYTQAAQALQAASELTPSVLCGLDGFIDRLFRVLHHREAATRIPFDQIADFGKRIVDAGGQSTNFELISVDERMGGNGPLMALGLAKQGARVSYVGSLGDPISELFNPLLSFTQAAYSLGQPGRTTALEFQDGKLFLGELDSLDRIDYARLMEVLGREIWHVLLEEADALALTNWTMLPHMTQIWEYVLVEDLPQLTHPPKHFFFDLADPSKRSIDDLRRALSCLSRFQSYGAVTLGLNLREAGLIYGTLFGEQAQGVVRDAFPEGKLPELSALAAAIRSKLSLDCVVIHDLKEAASASHHEGLQSITAPYCPDPLITTGAGDHFNAGFLMGRLCALEPAHCLALGASAASHYVETGASPTRSTLCRFMSEQSFPSQ